MIEFIVIGVVCLFVGLVIGSLGHSHEEIDPRTNTDGIEKSLDRIASALEPKKGKEMYDVGEQLNTIVKILSRAYPPKDK